MILIYVFFYVHLCFHNVSDCKTSVTPGSNNSQWSILMLSTLQQWYVVDDQQWCSGRKAHSPSKNGIYKEMLKSVITRDKSGPFEALNLEADYFRTESSDFSNSLVMHVKCNKVAKMNNYLILLVCSPV